MNKSILSLFLFFILCLIFSYSNYVCKNPSPSPFPHPLQSGGKKQTFCHSKYFYNVGNLKKHKIEVNCYNILQIIILSFGSVILLCISFLHLCNHVSYVTFNTNLSTCSKRKTIFKSSQCFWTYLSLVILGLHDVESLNDLLLLLIICTNPDYGSVFDLTLKFSKIVSWTIFTTLSIYIFSIAITPTTCILCLMVFQIWCHSCTKNANDFDINVK